LVALRPLSAPRRERSELLLPRPPRQPAARHAPSPPCAPARRDSRALGRLRHLVVVPPTRVHTKGAVPDTGPAQPPGRQAASVVPAAGVVSTHPWGAPRRCQPRLADTRAANPRT